MPTYEYECDACKIHFDEFQSMKDEPLKKCPKCGKKKLRRLIGSGAAIIFKGSGFYQTDYRSESYKSAAKADEKPAESTKSDTTPSTGKTDATPAPTPAPAKPGKESGKKSKSDK